MCIILTPTKVKIHFEISLKRGTKLNLSQILMKSDIADSNTVPFHFFLYGLVIRNQMPYSISHNSIQNLGN